MAKGKQAAVEGDDATKGTGLTQRLIDNSSRVHKQSNALLLTKVRSQLSRRSSCSSTKQVRRSDCEEAAIVPQMPAVAAAAAPSPPPPRCLRHVLA